jgi:hypothetical protein
VKHGRKDEGEVLEIVFLKPQGGEVLTPLLVDSGPTGLDAKACHGDLPVTGVHWPRTAKWEGYEAAAQFSS